MKKTLSLILTAVLLLATLSCFASCDNFEKEETKNYERTFIMGIDPEYDPFSYIGEDGNYTGFDVEVCKAVCELLNWKFEVFAVDWDNKLVQLDAKECDCVWAGMTILDSMKDAGYTLSDPYFDSDQVLVVKADSVYTTSASLAGKVVGVQLGTSGDKLLTDAEGDLKALGDSFASIQKSNSFQTCFTELGGGAVDAVFVDSPVAEEWVNSNAGYRIIDEDLASEQYGIAFRSDDKATCEAVQNALKTLVQNGKYAEIADKYPDLKSNLIFLK